MTTEKKKTYPEMTAVIMFIVLVVSLLKNTRIQAIEVWHTWTVKEVEILP